MILTHQVTQLWILLLQMCIGICFYLCIGHLCWQAVLRTCLSDKRLVRDLHTLVALHLSQQLAAHAIHWLDTAFAVQLRDMHTKACLEWLADSAFLQTESDIFKWLYHRATTKPTQVSATDSRTLIFGVNLCQCGEVCTLGDCQRIDAVHSHFRFFQTCFVAVRGHLHDVRCMYLFVLALLFHFGDMEAKWTAEYL